MKSYAIMYTILLIISGVWLWWRRKKAKELIGKKIIIKPFRNESVLEALGNWEAKLVAVKTENEDIWFHGQLSTPLNLDGFIFDRIKLKPKSIDDRINSHKAVVAYVYGGQSQSYPTFEFIDWALVQLG